jgi:hypothetical protein
MELPAARIASRSAGCNEAWVVQFNPHSEVEARADRVTKDKHLDNILGMFNLRRDLILGFWFNTGTMLRLPP